MTISSFASAEYLFLTISLKNRILTIAMKDKQTDQTYCLFIRYKENRQNGRKHIYVWLLDGSNGAVKCSQA